jgi:hypothetical protein
MKGENAFILDKQIVKYSGLVLLLMIFVLLFIGWMHPWPAAGSSTTNINWMEDMWLWIITSFGILIVPINLVMPILVLSPLYLLPVLTSLSSIFLAETISRNDSSKLIFLVINISYSLLFAWSIMAKIG